MSDHMISVSSIYGWLGRYQSAIFAPDAIKDLLNILNNAAAEPVPNDSLTDSYKADGKLTLAAAPTPDNIRDARARPIRRMTMSRKTERGVVWAAMRWLKQDENYQFPRQWAREHETNLARACRAHAKSEKAKRGKRK